MIYIYTLTQKRAAKVKQEDDMLIKYLKDNYGA
jgi:hypothetical protein